MLFGTFGIERVLRAALPTISIVSGHSLGGSGSSQTRAISGGGLFVGIHALVHPHVTVALPFEVYPTIVLLPLILPQIADGLPADEPTFLRARHEGVADSSMTQVTSGSFAVSSGHLICICTASAAATFLMPSHFFTAACTALFSASCLA